MVLFGVLFVVLLFGIAIGGNFGHTILFGLIIYSIYLLYTMNWKAAKEAESAAARRESQRRREEEEAEARRKQHEYNQQSLRQRLLGFVTDSDAILKSLPNEIKIAEQALVESEKEFAEGAFAPFWDAIENAVTHLARFNLGIQQIHDNSINYMEKKKELDSTPPPFKINVGTLPVATRTSDRMRGIVRRAQKDFHFATIYEQRKTNQLLVKGFTSLGHALNDMTYRITTSIDDLSSSIYDLASSNSESSRDLIAGVESLRYQMQSDAEASRAHEREERKMLDNIQRGEKPLF